MSSRSKEYRQIVASQKPCRMSPDLGITTTSKRFLGLSSYYRRFIPKIAQPLYQLTSKGVPFMWSAECEAAFTTLKGKLTVSPVLAYPSFDRGFTLETDASIQGWELSYHNNKRMESFTLWLMPVGPSTTLTKTTV